MSDLANASKKGGDTNASSSLKHNLEKVCKKHWKAMEKNKDLPSIIFDIGPEKKFGIMVDCVEHGFYVGILRLDFNAGGDSWAALESWRSPNEWSGPVDSYEWSKDGLELTITTGEVGGGTNKTYKLDLKKRTIISQKDRAEGAN